MQRELELNLEAQEVFGKGLALAHERIKELERIYDNLRPKMLEPMLDKEGVPIADTDGVPKTKVDLWVVKEMRDTLADLAAETGGRQKVIGLVTKHEPIDELLRVLQTVAVPELETGERGQTDGERGTEVVEGEYEVKADSGEGDSTGGGEYQPDADASDRCGGGDGALPAQRGDSGRALDPDELDDEGEVEE